MKKKALILAIGLAFSAPSIAVAKQISSNFVGISLGEIQTESYLNELFNGTIPLLFTDVKASKKLKIKLASDAVFKQIGAEKLPILNSLRFKIDVKNNKPFISIQSTQAIQMPFLNFVLEIESPQGSVYQDYTILIDPKGSVVDQQIAQKNTIEQLDELLLSSLTSSTKVNEGKRTHTVKSGDTLSQIAQALSTAEVSLKKMVAAIHQKNPTAFVDNNINRLKSGVTLQIPSNNELSGKKFETIAKTALKNKPKQSISIETNQTYKIKSGDTLSEITRKFVHKNVSFTKMMKQIHAINPEAFSKNRINVLKVGKILKIPSVEDISSKGSSVNYQQAQKKSIAEPNSNELNIPKVASTKDQKEFLLKGFLVEKGDTLEKITKQIGHKTIPFEQMMTAIYTANSDAFDKDNMTFLIEGSMIRLPSIAEVHEMKKNEKLAKPIKEKTLKHIDSIKIEKQSKNIKSKTKDAALINLEKRVRELKKGLDKAHIDLSSLEASLIDKEALIKKQSGYILKLARKLGSLDNGSVASVDTDNLENEVIQKVIHERIEVPTLNSEKTIGDEPIVSTKVSFIPEDVNLQLTTELKDQLVEYSQYLSGRQLFSAILALIFGFALIKYRRKIYAYTNISYNSPKYYPPFGEEEAKKLLKEKIIDHSDPSLDKLTEEMQKVKSVTTGFSHKDLQECENLANELTNDLEIKTSTHTDNIEWNELGKICDDYITEYRENQTSDETSITGEEFHTEEANKHISSSDEMTFEQFEALAAGIADKNSDKNINDTTGDTMMYGVDSDEYVLHDAEKHPIPFDELALMSNKIDLERRQQR